MYSLRRRAAVAVVTSVAVLGTLAVAMPAQAATISTQRAALWSSYSAASSDYNASWQLYKPLPLADRKIVGPKIDSGMTALKKVKPLIEAATTTYTVQRAQTALTTARARAATTRYSTWMLQQAMEARELARVKVNSHLNSYVAGSLSEATYMRSATAAAAVTTRVEADRKAGLTALGGTSKPTSTGPLSAAKSYASGNYSLSSAAGWAGVPGGCALPAANTTTWLGRATAPGAHLWTHPDWESSARGLAGDRTFDEAYDRALRQAANEQAQSYNWSSIVPGQVLPRRSLYLALRWRELGDADARTTLIRDVQTVVRRGPIDEPLQSAMALEAIATSIDLVEPGPATRTPLVEQMVVKWLGPASCQIADRSTSIYGGYNIPVIHNTAHAFGAVVAADAYPQLAAAMLQASLKAVGPSLAVLASDGGTPEGPDYWSFQGRYAAALYATTRSLYGTQPPVTLPNPARTSAYWYHSTADNGRIFTHSDSADISPRAYLPGWLGFATGDQIGGEALVRRAATSPEAWSIWWWPRGSHGFPGRTSTLFSRTGVATLHGGGATAWLKGGTSVTPHAQLDLGTVGYVNRDVLWAVDPYKGAYTGAYFDRATRWNIWEASTRSHSTIRVGGLDNHWSGASAPFTSFSASERTTSIDLRKALKNASFARRSVSLYSSGALKIADRVTTSVWQPYVWQWTTDASVSVSGRKAVLTRSGQRVVMEFSGLPSGSSLRVVSAPSGKKSSAGLPLRQLQVITPKVKSLSMAVVVG